MITITNIEFQQPFKSNIAVGIYKKRTLGKTRSRAGCYLIKENGVIVYVGMSKSCVVTAMYRHFYNWDDHQYRVSYFKKMSKNKYEAAIFYAMKEEAPKLEQSLIMLLNPRDNKEMYENIIPALLEKHGYVKANKKPGWEAYSDEAPF